MKTDKARVIGKISTILARASGGPGWQYDKKSGLYVRKGSNKNMVVLAGLSMMAKSIQYGHASSGKTIRYMEVGTAHATPSKSDTALGTAVERAEIDSWDNTNIAADPVVMIATKLWDTTEGNGNLMECGLFQESTGAPMFCRGLFGQGSITNATQANPVVITSAAHGLADGDLIVIENIEGMTDLNDNTYYVDVQDAASFELYADADLTTPVDGSGFGAFSPASPNAAVWTKIIPKTVVETLTINYSLTFPAE